VLDPDVPNSCENAPSYGCTPTTPPAFLLGGPPFGHEGPIATILASDTECNKHTNACGPFITNNHAVPSAEHAVAAGEYSYFVIHRDPTGKGIGFFTGSFTYRQASPDCNGCPPMGRGRDKNNETALSYTIPDSRVETLNIDIWTTQATPFVGHDLLTLIPPSIGQTSLCGNGITFQNVGNDLCASTPVYGTQPSVNFTIPDQKVSYWTYSVNMANHANFANKEKCNPPDCYIQRVIIPAALAQSGGLARNIQVQKASSVLPADAPANLGNATVDSIIFAYTTQLLDLDGDGIEDRDDPCPQDPTDFCKQDLINGGNCGAGQVFCADFNGDLGCLDAFLCDYKLDVNNDCLADGNDEIVLKGQPTTGIEAFNSTLFIGPFNP
jgi:hypothetical protein